MTLIRQSDPLVQFTEGCTLYLGASASHAVLYDVRRETVIRVPLLGSILVTHPARVRYNNAFLPEACTSNEGNEAAWPSPNTEPSP